jgi:hypothetical protein
MLSISEVHFKTLNRQFNGKLNILDFDRPRLIGSANGIIDLKAVHRLFGPFDLEVLSGNMILDGDFDIRMNTPVAVMSKLEIYKLQSNIELENISAQFFGDSRTFRIPGGEIAVRNQRAGFSDVQIKVGMSDITIDGTFNHIADYFKNEANLLVDASVSSKRLVLEDLTADTKKQERYRSWLLPSSIDGKLNLSLNKVSYSDHNYEQINTQMRFGKHKLIFPYLSGISARANLKGDLVIRETSPMLLEVSTHLRSSNVSFTPLFKEWNNFQQSVIRAENIKGEAVIDLSFQGPFDLYTNTYDTERFYADVSIQISDGALKNVSSMKLISKSMKESAAKLLLSKSTINEFEKKLLNLKFNSFQNRLSIKNGVITIPKMTIRSNALDVTLSGTHTFDNNVNYSFAFRFREIKGGQSSEFGDVIDDGTGMKVYLRMTGSIEDPTFSWDKEAMKKEKLEQREEAKENFKSALKTGFGINKNDSTVQELKGEEHKEEKLIMEFNNDSIASEFTDEEKKKKKSALQKRIEKWKNENKEGEPTETFEIDD